VILVENALGCMELLHAIRFLVTQKISQPQVRLGIRPLRPVDARRFIDGLS
jgi:hypothetical protein